MCCASAAEPPFPATSNCPPADRDEWIKSMDSDTPTDSPGRLLATRKCSSQIDLILPTWFLDSIIVGPYSRESLVTYLFAYRLSSLNMALSQVRTTADFVSGMTLC